jgi:hypothetical protein
VRVFRLHASSYKPQAVELATNQLAACGLRLEANIQNQRFVNELGWINFALRLLLIDGNFRRKKEQEQTLQTDS